MWEGQMKGQKNHKRVQFSPIENDFGTFDPFDRQNFPTMERMIRMNKHTKNITYVLYNKSTNAKLNHVTPRYLDQWLARGFEVLEVNIVADEAGTVDNPEEPIEEIAPIA